MKKLALFLCAGLACFALADCGSGDSTDLSGLVRDYSQAQEAGLNLFCACATDVESSFCKENPQSCFADMDACMDGMGWQALTSTQLSCTVDAMKTDAAQSEKAAKCMLDAIIAYKTCLEQVSKCAAEEVLQCEDAARTAGSACPNVSVEVEKATEACFES